MGKTSQRYTHLQVWEVKKKEREREGERGKGRGEGEVFSVSFTHILAVLIFPLWRFTRFPSGGRESQVLLLLIYYLNASFYPHINLQPLP